MNLEIDRWRTCSGQIRKVGESEAWITGLSYVGLLAVKPQCGSLVDREEALDPVMARQWLSFRLGCIASTQEMRGRGAPGISYLARELPCFSIAKSNVQPYCARCVWSRYSRIGTYPKPQLKRKSGCADRPRQSC
jgi:hypothetical protein